MLQDVAFTLGFCHVSLIISNRLRQLESWSCWLETFGAGKGQSGGTAAFSLYEQCGAELKSADSEAQRTSGEDGKAHTQAFHMSWPHTRHCLHPGPFVKTDMLGRYFRTWIWTKDDDSLNRIGK